MTDDSTSSSTETEVEEVQSPMYLDPQYLSLTYCEGGITKSILIETITNLTVSPSKNVTIIPIASKKAESAFPLELGSTIEISAEFKRVQPVGTTNFDDTSSDSRKWSNLKWCRNLTSFIDRWQMRTDGCTLKFNTEMLIAESGEWCQTYQNPNVPILNKNVYIKSLRYSYSNKFNSLVTGSISFMVGRMHIDNTSLKAVASNDDGVQSDGQCLNVTFKPGKLPTWVIGTSSKVQEVFGIYENTEYKPYLKRYELPVPLPASPTTYFVKTPSPPASWTAAASCTSNPRFRGWSTTNGDGAVVAAVAGAAFKLPSGDVTLYALWGA